MSSIRAVCVSLKRCGTVMMKLLSVPQCGAVVARGFAQAAFDPGAVQRSDLLSGVRVAGARQLGAALSACTVMFQTGTRAEQDDTLGATHFVRAMSAASGLAYSGYGKMRLLHQRGCYLSSSADRQSIAFTLRCPRDLFPEMKYYLLDTAARCCFHEHEVSTFKPFVRNSLARIHPLQRLLDLLQKACWAGPLSNSVFCEEERIEPMRSSYLRQYVMNFNTNNCSLGSFGLPFEEVMKLAEALSLEFMAHEACTRVQTKSTPRSNYVSYDLGRGSDTWIAVGVPGTGTYNIGSTYKHALVASAYGAHCGRADHAPPPPPCSATDDLLADCRAFSVSYVDTGVFGIVARTRSSTAGKVAQMLISSLSNIDKLDAGLVDIAKKRLKLELATHDENCVRVSEDMALQAARNLVIDSESQSFSIIDSIPNEEVVQTAKIISSKQPCMSMAVVGDIAAVPLDILLNRNLCKMF